MGNYYEQTQQMINSLEDLIIKSEDGISRDQLTYILTKKYQIGSLTIKKRIDLLKRLELIEEGDEGLLKWIGLLTQQSAAESD